jgi:hypothetical protein
MGEFVMSNITKVLMSGTKVTSETQLCAIHTGSDLGIQLYLDDTTPSAATFTAVAATDLCTANGHGMATGLKVVATSTTTLPTGVPTDPCYVIAVSANTFKLATTLADALAGVAVDIEDTGTGTHTLTPSTGGARSLALSFSIDGVRYSNAVLLEPASAGDAYAMTVAAITLPSSAATKIYSLSRFKGIKFVKAVLTMEDGQGTVEATVVANR